MQILKEIRNCGFSFPQLTKNYPEFTILKNIPQNSSYHAEGDVYCHTNMVCEKLIELSEWQELNPQEQELLFLSAAFHDIGKPICTKFENGEWISPKHTILGEKEFRRLAYRNANHFGLSFAQRELVAKLIRYHGMPVWFWKKKRPEFNLMKASESIPLRLLYLLSKADLQGRITTTSENLLENVELFAEYAKEQNIWEKSYAFSGLYTKFEYFHKDNLWCGAELYDNTEFDVILMSGLPLSGKDSWIEKYGANMPIISLDSIREEYKISPTKNSGKVANIARERARVLLRQKQPFIWNATNIIQETRQKLVTLFADYGARVHIIYLEVPYEKLFIRNQKRKRYIPENVLEEMICKLEIPDPWEAYKVTHIVQT